MSFEPTILGFLCNWCSYAGADLAGVSRLQYPPNIRVIRVMCSGRVDPKFVFEALKIGIDGVIIMGCHPGDCHYIEGNYEAEKKFIMLKKFLNFINLDNRVRLEWVSASEGMRFAEVVTDFTNSIKKLGPSPVKDNEDLLIKLKAIEMAAESYRIRALVGRERTIIEMENVYGEKVPKDKFDTVFNFALYDEYMRQQILLSLKKNSKSVKDLAKELNIDPSEILKHILILKGRAHVAMGEIEGITPIYEYTMEG
jgi:F420-non-reducing hydrogenase iron-sulfur subunit